MRIYTAKNILILERKWKFLFVTRNYENECHHECVLQHI